MTSRSTLTGAIVYASVRSMVLSVSKSLELDRNTWNQMNVCKRIITTIIIIILLFWEFFSTSVRTVLSILADLNNSVVWMVSTRPLISKSSSLLTNIFVTLPSTTVTIGITVTFMFHSFLRSLARSRYFFFSFCFLSVLLCGQLERQSPQFRRFFLSFSLFFFVDSH